MEATEREKLIYNFLAENNVSLEELLDTVIKVEGIIGVGLISLEDAVKRGINKHF